MSIDKIVETISKIDDYEELMRIARVLEKRSAHLTQAAMQRVKKKFSAPCRIRIKDEKGDYHIGLLRGFGRKKVRIIIYSKDMKISPIDMERLEAEVVEEK